MQRYFSSKKVENSFLLNDDDLYHIRTVMRMKDNDNIIVVYQEQAYLCCLHNVKQNIEIRIVKEIENTYSNLPEVTIIVPILKEAKMDLILQKCTELGVDKIIPIITNRSIIKLKESDYNKKIVRWKRIVKEASEQSHRNTIPVLLEIKKISDLETLDGIKVVCSTKEKVKNIKNVMKKVTKCDKISIVVGPEGGLDLKEEEKLNAIGFESVTLGSRILRVETAPIFILSLINYEFME